MGNTQSDALNHSFKRFRTSETEQVSQNSPVSFSPKRKVGQPIIEYLQNDSRASVENLVEEIPVILYNSSDQFALNITANCNDSTVDSNPQSMDIQDCPEENSFNSESVVTSVNLNYEDQSAGIELSDEQIIECLRAKNSFLYLTDGDVLRCLTQACSIKE